MWTLALNGTGRHGKFIVIALKCYESVLDGKPILLLIQDGYVRDMRQNHHERHLGSNVESRPPMLPYLLLIKLIFFMLLLSWFRLGTLGGGFRVMPRMLLPSMGARVSMPCTSISKNQRS